MRKKPSVWKRFTGVFADNSRLMTLVGRVSLLAELNLCWLVCSLPVVTGGASLTALYAVLTEEPGLEFDTAFKRFFQVFARQFRRTLPCGC